MDPLKPKHALRDLIFPIRSLVQLHKPGSYEYSLAEMATRGIKDQIEWILANLEKSGAGDMNWGLVKKYVDDDKIRELIQKG